VKNAISFEDVWLKLMKHFSRRRVIYTLVRKIRNDIISIEKDKIKVKSQMTNRIRTIPKSQFKLVWERLSKQGYYVSKDHMPFIHSQIICSFLSELEDLVEVSYNPLTLRLKKDISKQL